MPYDHHHRNHHHRRNEQLLIIILYTPRRAGTWATARPAAPCDPGSLPGSPLPFEPEDTELC